MQAPIRLETTTSPALRGYDVTRGWSDDIASQLVTASRESAIRSAMPRDATERFSDTAAANEWHESKRPIVYALCQAAQLAGVIWFSQQERADIDADYTFAIRLYDVARGKHLAEPFALLAETDFRQQENPHGIWLETDMENSAARILYRKLGYVVVGASSSRITMRR